MELEDVVDGVGARLPHGPGWRLPRGGGQGAAADALGHILRCCAVGMAGAPLGALWWRRLRVLRLGGDDVHPAGAVAVVLRVVLILCAISTCISSNSLMLSHWHRQFIQRAQAFLTCQQTTGRKMLIGCT